MGTQTMRQIEDIAERYRDAELNRYLEFIGNSDESKERDVIDDVADDGDSMDGFVSHLIDDTSEFRKIVAEAVRMNRRCAHKSKPLDVLEVGRLFMAWINPELDKYVEQTVEDAR